MENQYYRDNLEQILEFTHGKQILTLSQVRDFTGIRHPNTLKKRFPFNGSTISAAALARAMAEGARS